MISYLDYLVLVFEWKELGEETLIVKMKYNVTLFFC